MPKQSAGIMLYRRTAKGAEVFLVHSGGPYWAKKDKDAWSIPKGEFDADEAPLDTAKREFHEETGCPVPAGELIELGTIKQLGGKIVYGWALEGDLDASNVKSNTFSMEWPPKSGQQQEFPEVDRAEWFDLARAASKIRGGQDLFLERLAEMLGLKIVKPEQPSLF